MPKKRNKFGTGGSTMQLGDTGPSATALQYRGPSHIPSSIRPQSVIQELHTIVVAQYNNAAPSLIDSNVSSGTVRANGSDFATYAGLFREYRTLSIRVDFVPAWKHSLNTAQLALAAAAPFVTVCDRDDVSAIGATANVVANTSLRLFSLNHPWTRENKMQSPAESEFIATSGDPTQYFVVKYFSAATIQTAVVLGYFYYSYIVQFRTRI